MTSNRLRSMFIVFSGGTVAVGMIGLTAGCGNGGQPAPTSTTTSSPSSPAPSPTDKDINPTRATCSRQASKHLHPRPFHQASILESTGSLKVPPPPGPRTQEEVNSAYYT